MDVRNFRLQSLTDENERDVRRLLYQYKHFACRSSLDVNFPAHILREKEIDGIVDLLQKNGFGKVLMRGGDVFGVIVAEKSLWDTERFGFGIGKIRGVVVSDILNGQNALDAKKSLIKACLTWMKRNDVKCVITRVNVDSVNDIVAYEQNGFQLADVLITFHLNVGSLNPTPDSLSSSLITIRPSRAEDEMMLMEIARTAFTNDHFHRDRHFPKHKSNELFAKWIYNCCHGLADMVLVAAEEKEEPCGFITCKIEKMGREIKYGVIDLIAVSPLHQSKKVGTQLVREAIRWFAQNVQLIFVGTQANNRASIRTYEKVGFRLLCTELTFHKWFQEEPHSARIA